MSSRANYNDIKIHGKGKKTKYSNSGEETQKTQKEVHLKTKRKQIK